MNPTLPSVSRLFISSASRPRKSTSQQLQAKKIDSKSAKSTPNTQSDKSRCSQLFVPLSPHDQELLRAIRPTLADYTRTIAHICRSGILSTVTERGDPVGSSVDFVLDQKGHPIFFFSKLVTSIARDARASFFCKIPLQYEHTTSLSSKSASIQGKLQPVNSKEVNSLKIAFSLTHPSSADHVACSDDIFFAKLQPESILYSTGDFGTKPIPVDLQEYESAYPDLLAQEIPTLLPRLNIARQYELRLLCKHFLNMSEDVETVQLLSVDKLGVDLRVARDNIREEFRVAFRHPVNSAEDAKSELVKLFQECYQRERLESFTKGGGKVKVGFLPNQLPTVIKYA